MAMRRRIKVAANLTAAKRKVKTETSETKRCLETEICVNPKEDSSVQGNKDKNSARVDSVSSSIEDKIATNAEGFTSESVSNVDNKETPDISDIPSSSSQTKSISHEDKNEKEILNEVESNCDANPQSELTISTTESNVRPVDFKYPQRLDCNRFNGNIASGVSDGLYQDDSDESLRIMQKDLQTTVCGLSLTKTTSPRTSTKSSSSTVQRRNSFIGLPHPAFPLACDKNSTAADCGISVLSTERHHSNSSSATINIQENKCTSNVPHTRVRTESSCSVFSESYISSPLKPRKHDMHNQHRKSARRDYESRFSNGVPDRSTFKMSDLIFYNPIANPMEQKSALTPEIKNEPSVLSTQVKLKSEPREADSNCMPVPQLKLSATGELILDDKSLEIETTAEQEARKVLAQSSLIYHDENTGMNGFYRRQKRTKDWLPEETVRFYRCLHTIGTDFSLMHNLFPKRTRRELKLKFKREEKTNGTLINKALLHPKLFDIHELKEQLEKEDREEEETARNCKQRKSEESKAVKKMKVKTSRAARAITCGDEVYKSEKYQMKKKRKRKRVEEENSDLEKIRNHKTNPHRTNKETNEDTRGRNRNTVDTLPIKSESLIEDTQQSEFVDETEQQFSVNTHQQKSNVGTSLNEAITDNEAFSQTEMQQMKRLDQEINELLSADVNESNIFQFVINDTDSSSPTEFTYPDDETCEEFVDNSNLSDNDATKTLVNMDNGVVTFVTDNIETAQIGSNILSVQPKVIPSPAQNVPNLDENTVQEILSAIANGKLVVISTVDANANGAVINEIYGVNAETGVLCEEPLNLPDEIIESIVSVMT